MGLLLYGLAECPHRQLTLGEKACVPLIHYGSPVPGTSVLINHEVTPSDMPQTQKNIHTLNHRIKTIFNKRKETVLEMFQIFILFNTLSKVSWTVGDLPLTITPF